MFKVLSSIQIASILCISLREGIVLANFEAIIDFFKDRFGMIEIVLL